MILKEKNMEAIFDPQILADDLCEVHRYLRQFFLWSRPRKIGKNPIKSRSKEWNLHETVAHLCALTGAGLESIQATL